jgi:hypothetical protein
MTLLSMPGSSMAQLTIVSLAAHDNEMAAYEVLERARATLYFCRIVDWHIDRAEVRSIMGAE